MNNAATGTVVGIIATGDHPLAGTGAQRMLQRALDNAQKEKGQSQRFIAGQLGYKSSVVLSHMALGRVPIPVDRAMDFARYLGMDQNEFLLAVLEQRHPDINFRRLLGTAKAKPSSKNTDSALVEELEAIAGMELDRLPMPQVSVLREVVSDERAARRWIRPNEIGMIEHLRKTHPGGISPDQARKLRECVEAL